MSINKIFISKSNILILDSENKIWIMGDNHFKKTGYLYKENDIIIPILTNIKLNNDEIIKFYSLSHYCVVYTKKGNIFLSNFYTQNPKDEVVTNMADDNDSTNETESVSDLNSNRSCSTCGGVTYHGLQCTNSSAEYTEESEESDYIVEHDNIIINNYFDYISNLINYNNKTFVDNDGFTHFQYEIKKMMICGNVLFFVKDTKICIFYPEISIKNVIKKHFNLSTKYINRKQFSYIELILPFDYYESDIEMKENYIYIYNNGYHHIISTDTNSDELVWLYFKTDIIIDKIFYVSFELALYIENEGCLYKYMYDKHEFHKITNKDEKYFLVKDYLDDNDAYMCYILRQDGLYQGTNEKCANYKYMLKYLMDINTYNPELILVNLKKKTKFLENNLNLYINVRHFKYFKLYSFGIIYYDDDNLYICTRRSFDNIPDITLTDIIDVCDKYYYCYIFNINFESIEDIQFTSSLILIKSDGKYYYREIIFDNPTVKSFTEIFLYNDHSKMIYNNMIIRKERIYKYTVDLYIDIDSNKFDKLLNIVDILKHDTTFSVVYKTNDETISYGNGVKRELFESAIKYFADNFLIKYNVLSEFNVKKLAIFNDNELINIGKILHAYICYNLTSLPIRLPLILLKKIMGVKISLEELEYFAMHEDPELYNKISLYRNNPEEFENLSTNYKSYKEYIKYICKYNYLDDNKEINKIAKLIAKGIKLYNNIKNLSIMNYPTLDYYLSGEYKVNRDLLINNLKINDNDDLYSEQEKIEIKNKIIEIIKNLSEENLITLLRNWSGSSVVNEKEKYIITIVSNNKNPIDISFRTCNMELIIAGRLINEFKFSSLLLELLTSSILTIID